VISSAGTLPPTFTGPHTSTGPDVFAAGLALLAFVMALYVLAARDQKTPYVTHSVFSTALIVLFAVLLSATGRIVDAFGFKFVAERIATAAVAALGVAVLNVFVRVWQAQNRKLNLRDDHLIKNLRIVIWFKNKLRRSKARPTFEHNPAMLTAQLTEDLKQTKVFPEDQFARACARNASDGGLTGGFSATWLVPSFAVSDQRITELAKTFLRHKCWLQYTSCTRHPIEFIQQLRRAWQAEKDGDWRQAAARIVAVDAYSAHFGFTDSVHDEASRRLEADGVECVTAKASYAGLHTAAARGFNIIKRKSEKIRQPTLLVYEGPRALIDLESPEQHRIFIRHLLPSERLWGGMVTLVIESGATEEEVRLLRSYSDVFVEETAT
jgi:hypothetical protein